MLILYSFLSGHPDALTCNPSSNLISRTNKLRMIFANFFALHFSQDNAMECRFSFWYHVMGNLIGSLKVRQLRSLSCMYFARLTLYSQPIFVHGRLSPNAILRRREIWKNWNIMSGQNILTGSKLCWEAISRQGTICLTQYCALTKYFPWTKVEWLLRIS